MKYTHQKSSNKLWQDESGLEIPYSRITKVERLHERTAVKIAKEAIGLNSRLVSFNTLITELSEDAYEAFMKSKGVDKKTKGNYTWFNFDRSIKIEINVNNPITFDDLTISAAKTKLDQFLENNLESKNKFLKQMAINAFETQRNGQLDVKQVMRFTRWEEKINHPVFSEVVKLINQAIRRPKSKSYRRVWVKDEQGKYQSIELNLSSL